MINFSFFSVKISKPLLWNRNEENILLFNHERLLCHALLSKFFYLNPFIMFKLLWTRFLGFGDTLPSESSCHFWPYPYLCWDARLTQIQKRKKIRGYEWSYRDPWYCWWRINRYCRDSSGFELLHQSNVRRYTFAWIQLWQIFFVYSLQRMAI